MNTRKNSFLTTVGFRENNCISFTQREAYCVKNIGIPMYGCDKDESKWLHDLSSRFGVIPIMTSSSIFEI
ncbi:hypothetical protein [Neobacillus sp.]|jgi:hypothetical protein|uniref:hypothetical protein n=1 Tax=Neobacillus TaxID=2675232 RepID=UPI0035B51FB2